MSKKRREPERIVVHSFEREGDLIRAARCAAFEAQSRHRSGTEPNIRELENLKRALEE